MELTQEYLKSVLNYCPETGVFTWRVTGRGRRLNRVAGYDDGRTGYQYISVGGKRYLAHRLAWLYIIGDWPKDQIDHIDGEKSNNIFSNLREANNSQNNSNKPAQQNNQSGYKGVSFVNRKKPWVAQLTVEGKNIWIGRFETKELAYAAYCKAAEKHHGEFAHY